MARDNEHWWIAGVGNVLIWARLRILSSGVAEVFSADGETLRYDDEGMAREALMDADFRAHEGMDDEDAAQLGFDLDSLETPRAEDDEEILQQMTVRLPEKS